MIITNLGYVSVIDREDICVLKHAQLLDRDDAVYKLPCLIAIQRCTYIVEVRQTM